MIEVIFLLSEDGQRAEALAGRSPVQRVARAVEPSDPLWARAVALARFTPAGAGRVEIGHTDWTEDGADPVSVASGNTVAQKVLTYDSAGVELVQLLSDEEGRRAGLLAYENRSAEIRAKADAAAAARLAEARAKIQVELAAKIEGAIATMTQLGGDASAIRIELDRDGPSNALAQAAVEAALSATLDSRDRQRKAWIAEHGSARLRACVAEGFEHNAIYFDERLAMDRPGWCVKPLRLDLSASRNPSSAALDLLTEARAIDGSCELVYATISRRRDVAVERGPGVTLPRFAWTGQAVTAEFDGATIVYGVVINAHGARERASDIPL